MIADEPDEGADILDDEAVIDKCLGGQPGLPDSPGRADPAVPRFEWPNGASGEVLIPVDSDTLAWFRGNHANWKHQMTAVLRGWVATQSAPAKTGAEAG
jgi:hypothetical protein